MKLRDLFPLKKACRLLVNRDGPLVQKYEYFKEFLEHNYHTLRVLAELEQLYYAGAAFSMGVVEQQCGELLTACRRLVEALNNLGRGEYAELLDTCEKIQQEVSVLLYPAPFCQTGDLVKPLEALSRDSYAEAGGKATNLALLGNVLGLPTPRGFVVTAAAFGRFLEENGLTQAVEGLLAGLSPDDLADVESRSRAIRELILAAPVPAVLSREIMAAYEALEARTRPGVRLAMRSSAVGEDSAASFAGQYLTRLNVTREELLQAYKEVVAGKYAPRAVLYRLRFGLDDRDTPMCVAGIDMVDSRASGVLYTVDPALPDSGLLKISSIWGQGEHLVSGEASPDGFFVNRGDLRVTDRVICRKPFRLVAQPEGGLQLEEAPEGERERPSLDDATISTLAQAGLNVENFFGGPQDVEWALDGEGRLFFLQSRPLGLVQTKTSLEAKRPAYPGHPIVLDSGRLASPGVAAGVVVHPGEDLPAALPESPILVAKTALPEYAGLMGRLRGIITDVGSVTSHLASVAREFGVPTIVDAKQATTVLKPGEPITMVADTVTVYQGHIPELMAKTRPVRQHIYDSPMHRRFRAVLDRLSPLYLTNPQDPGFSPAGCQTLHDVIRFAHERGMQEMFGLGAEAKGEMVSVRLTSHLPLPLYLIDLGGGLTSGLTTCDRITPEHLESVPMRALWRGLSHPGINWSGGIEFATRDLLSIMAKGAMTPEGELPGGESFAILSRDYANLSLKFGYHYANLDAFCGPSPDENYFSLQFSGGLGDRYGRSLRLSFLAKVLSRLGCRVRITGDLLDAFLPGLECAVLETHLDQVGRLLASSRLLDLAITREGNPDRLVEAFFQKEYDFFHLAQEKALPGFYTPVGDWSRLAEEGRTLILQDGSNYGSSVSSGLALFMGKMMGAKFQEFLDHLGAYYYFPLAIAKGSRMGDGAVEVSARSVAGTIDQAAGLAFGLRDGGDYFVLRINALEDNVALFEYVNNKRVLRLNVPHPIETGRWYHLRVEIAGASVKGYLDGDLLLEYTADLPVYGFVGLWAKADSVSYFEGLTIETDSVRRMLGG